MKIITMSHRAVLGAALAAALAMPASAAYDGSGAQPVSRGATGRAALTQNNLIFGNGANPVGFLSPTGLSGRCVVSDGTSWAAQYCLVTGAIVGTAPVSVNVTSGVATVALTIDSNFDVISNALALKAIASGRLLANAGAGSAEPTETTLTAYLDRAIGSASGQFAARIGGTWSGATFGTGLAFLGSILNLQPAAAGAIGGVNSIAQVASQWVQYIDTAGLPHLVQPAFTDLVGQATLAQLPTLGANTALGSIAGGAPAALSKAQITTLINQATAVLSGAVPAWPNNTTTYFRGDGTYATLNVAAVSGLGTGVGAALGLAINIAGGVVVPAAALTANGVVYGGGSGASPGATAAGVNGQVFLGVTGGPPQWGTVSGDATISNAGVLTLATVNSNTGAIGSATQCVTVTNNAKGLTTAVTAATCTPAVGSISGLGTGVATALGVNLSAAGGLTTTIASGATAMGTGAITSGTCATVVTATATGTATTDVLTASFNGDPTAVTGYIPTTSGMLTIIAYPTLNTANFKVCNNTLGSITPGAITLNWRVVR
jgi:hypothetical protein